MRRVTWHLVLCSPALVVSVPEVRQPSLYLPLGMTARTGCLPAPSLLGCDTPSCTSCSFPGALASSADQLDTAFIGFLLFPALLPCPRQWFLRSPSKDTPSLSPPSVPLNRGRTGTHSCSPDCGFGAPCCQELTIPMVIFEKAQD